MTVRPLECRRHQGLRGQPRRRPSVRGRPGADLLQVRLHRVSSVIFPGGRSARRRHLCAVWHHVATAIEVIAFLLFIGAMGKSAQLGFHVWLPDAMEGPTPVSALIHAATMVTAGVFLMARMSPLMEFAPTALTFVTFVGAIDRACSPQLLAACRTTSSASSPIPPAPSLATCSRPLASASTRLQMFHLITHAFFKALLFLSAGSVIHAMSDEQDMRKMGGLAKRHSGHMHGDVDRQPRALAGIPPFAGYWSKDAIIAATWASGSLRIGPLRLSSARCWPRS